jgi:hypothetical protein
MQRGDVNTFAASLKSARERAAGSAMPAKAGRPQLLLAARHRKDEREAEQGCERNRGDPHRRCSRARQRAGAANVRERNSWDGGARLPPKKSPGLARGRGSRSAARGFGRSPITRRPQLRSTDLIKNSRQFPRQAVAESTGGPYRFAKGRVPIPVSVLTGQPILDRAKSSLYNPRALLWPRSSRGRRPGSSVGRARD